MAELQVIPARHGTATFVPAGQVIKIVNTSGTQVVDTWAFALPRPEPKKGSQEEKDAEAAQSKQGEESKDSTTKQAPAKKKAASKDLPSQEDAEKATGEALKEGETAEEGQQQKKGWSSYVPSIPWSASKKSGESKEETAAKEEQQKKDSKTWSSYFPSGQGFSNYIPNAAKDTVSTFAGAHQRDPNKSYMEQLQEFSKTPVGAAGLSGLAALSGSGYGGSLYSGYQAWSAHKATAPQMEFLSMPHSRASICHLRPRVNDTLVSNVRQPILTIVEDTSGGVHDTLIAACDPARYKELNVENWEQHGSCAENLVLALKELNERAGLKGNKAVGGDVTINSVPAPFNLFMNIPWVEDGDIAFAAPKSKKGGFVRMKAERDVVVVMSACPQDVLDINGRKPTDAHFIVEGEEETTPAVKRTQVRKRPPPRKISSSHATSTIASQSGIPPSKPPTTAQRRVPAKRPAPATAQKQESAQSTAPAQTQQESHNATSGQTQQANEGTTSAPKQSAKKYVPKKVVPKNQSAANGTTAAEPAQPAAAEKKKPRKLNRPTAPAAES